jgi:cytochrome c556
MSKPAIRVSIATGVVALLLVAGCAAKEAADPAAITREDSVIDLMKDTIAPTADALWGAVGSEATETGTKDFAPGTDAEWEALRHKAQILIDASKALAEEGRVVAHRGQKLKDPPGEGDLTPEQAQAEIGRSREAFVAFATVMQGVGGDYLDAIDKRNVDAITEIGGKLDEVCEACHMRYWYPNAASPAAP